MEITFRPHHFLCALNFKGKGYSPAFVDNFQKIVDLLNSPSGDETLITVVSQTDSICDPCPQKQGLLCETQTKITSLDQAHSDALALENITQITWGEAKKRIKNKLSISKFDQICYNCSWKKLGICEKSLTNFLNK